ncbi:hypothetical protein, partial [Staphylococcus pseudintermedius]|uniref:hypothetical protein n=1 Tax=Staphylococcus pseudintermedius TaxID=283734 RepID=UPI001E314F56
VALTLAGTAFSAHQSNAAEQVSPETTPTNVLDDQYASKQADNAKQTTQATTLAGSKEYKHPAQIDTTQVHTLPPAAPTLNRGNKLPTPPHTPAQATPNK